MKLGTKPHLTRRVCVGEWAAVETLDSDHRRRFYEGRVTAISAHRMTVYNDPSATRGRIEPETGPVELRRADVFAISVNLGR